MAVRFDYPTNGWSNGKMRKRGQKPDEVQVAMDQRQRMRPALEDPGIAEAEKLAGASRALSARGGPIGAGAAMLEPQVRANKQMQEAGVEAKEKTKAAMTLQGLTDDELQQAIDDHLAEQNRRKNGATAEAQ